MIPSLSRTVRCFFGCPGASKSALRRCGAGSFTDRVQASSGALGMLVCGWTRLTCGLPSARETLANWAAFVCKVCAAAVRLHAVFCDLSLVNRYSIAGAATRNAALCNPHINGRMHAFLLFGLLRTGDWQRTRCRTALSIEPAPAGFVGDEELELGERCVQALWAKDDGVQLAAGALVSCGNEFDIWLGDASNPLIGPNRQLRGAIPLALKLLVTFLATFDSPATRLRAVPPPPPPRKRLADPLGGASCASAAALEAPRAAGAGHSRATGLCAA